MKAKEVFCELFEDSVEATYCLPTNNYQQTVQNAEPMKLRNRNKRHHVLSKVKEQTGFKMKLRSQCVASYNSMHKIKHTAKQPFENKGGGYKISQTKGAPCRDDLHDVKSDSICWRVSPKREISVVASCSPESTKKKVTRAKKSKSNRYSEQATVSGDNDVHKGHPRRSERLKRISKSTEFAEIPTKKKKTCTSSTDKEEEKNITPQTSAVVKEETEDTHRAETKNEITKKPDLSLDTVQSAIRKVFPTLVDILDPKKIIDKMLESTNYRHSSLRDIMDNSNTSDRNRKLLEWISKRNVTVYTHFKQCLLDTRQKLLFKLLEIAEEDGDTREITKHIIQNTIWLNSEGNKLYSELVAIADLKNRRIICFVFEYIGTTVCKALFMKKVNDLSPNDGKWTFDTFLNINRQNIEKINHHCVKCGSDIIFPRAQLDSWGVSLFCLILINIFEITPSLRLCLEWLLDQRKNIFEYNDQNQNRKLIDLKKYLMTIAAETEDDEFIKTVEENFSQLEQGVLPNTDCEAITRSINHAKEELIEEGRCNRDSIIDSCQQGQSEIKYVVRKGDKKIENKLDTILAEVQQLNNACRNKEEQSVPATTMVKILVRGSESDVSICSQIVEAIKCRGTPSQLSDAVEEVRLKFQSKDWTIMDAEVGCIELYIQCSSVVSLLDLLKNYVNGNLDACLEPLEKAARLLDGSSDLKFETVFYEESFYNILSSIDFRQFEQSSIDVYQGSHEDRQTQTSDGNKAEVEFIEVISVDDSELNNLKEKTEEKQDLLVDDPNTRLIVLGLNFGHDSEKVETHLPRMSPMSDETDQCTSSSIKQGLDISYTSHRYPKLQNSSPPRKPDTDQSFISRVVHEEKKILEKQRRALKIGAGGDWNNEYRKKLLRDILCYGNFGEFEYPKIVSLDIASIDEGRLFQPMSVGTGFVSFTESIRWNMFRVDQYVYLKFGLTIRTKKVRNKDGGILYIHKAHKVSRTSAAYAMNIRDGDEILLIGGDHFAPELTHAEVEKLLTDINVDGQSRFSLVIQRCNRTLSRRTRKGGCLIETSAILAYRDLHYEYRRIVAKNVRIFKRREKNLNNSYRRPIFLQIHDDGITVNIVKCTDADNNKQSRDAFEELRQQIVREHRRKVPSSLQGGLTHLEDQDVPGTEAASYDNRKINYENFCLSHAGRLSYIKLKSRGLFPNKNNSTQINLPISLKEKYKSNLDNNLVRVINLLEQYDHTQLQFIRENKLTFSSEPFKLLFKGLVDKITILDQVIILDVANILAGGYTDSHRLLGVVKANLPRIKDEILQEEVTSFLKGVLTFTHLPRQIPNRVLKFTYGIKTNLRFREGIDPEGKRRNCERGDTCKQRFTKHVEIGHVVNFGEVLTEIPYCPLNKSQTQICLHVYASDLKNPQYTDDNCTFIGKMIIDLSSQGDLNRYAKVSLTFKDNKIFVTAKDMKTGKKSAVAFDSLG